MRALLVKYKQPLTSEAFAIAFRKIMLHWVQKVMGPRPPDSTASLLAGLKSWTCNCDVCPPVRNFLTAKPEESNSWTRIGAPKRRHLETFLSKYAKQIATFAMIRSTPQGITVTKTKAMVGPAKWAHGQAEGKKLLRSISANQHELQAVLGPDYARIVAGLEGRSMGLAANIANVAATAPVASGSSTMPAMQPVPQGVLHTTGATPAAAAVAATAVSSHPTSMPNAAPMGVAATHVSSVLSTSAPSSKRVDDAEHAQRKRRKRTYDEQDVIDLT
ncbi:hypothetical protein TRAPUB_13493 [Trametes pubescens]|uniref:Uncharacterized protein n=1 Tax=Trametes pubescens TaxID=154538 RepID=A0A1M2VQW7_TRAPU|nr:hypothetical protein TRAPUB_13493 [Trametes pubescens]